MDVDATTLAAPIEVRREGLYRRNLGAWEVVLLSAFTLAMLGTAWVQSRKSFFVSDELYTAVLVSNPHFTAMLKSIRQCADGNPPLFLTLEWMVARVFGMSEFALRAIPALSVTLAGWVVFFTVRPLTGPRVAGLAMILIFGLSRDVFAQMWNARCYGSFLLMVSVAVYLAMKLGRAPKIRARDCWAVFLTHCALVYLHVYGLFFSGVLLVGMAVVGWIRGRIQWRLLACIVGAWAAFILWVPSMLIQIRAVRGGTYTPRFPLGLFVDHLAFQTPLAVVLLLVGLLLVASLLSPRPGFAIEEAGQCSAPCDWSALALIAALLLAVPVATWMASNVMKPLYIQRYVFPGVDALAFLLAIALVGLFKLRPPVLAAKHPLPQWTVEITWTLVLGFCLLFQPLRAWKNPGRPATPFVDNDFGHPNLPLVFEDSNDWLVRAYYGGRRDYYLLTDHEAAEADPGYFTKLMDRTFQSWHPFYQTARVVTLDELPEFPDGFLAVDDDLAKTYEWLFQHRSNLEVRLLGTWPSEESVYGQKRVYLVKRKARL